MAEERGGRKKCDRVFFFQAEDGIRDKGNVTGVQTCALPISISISFNISNFIIANTWFRANSTGHSSRCSISYKIGRASCRERV